MILNLVLFGSLVVLQPVLVENNIGPVIVEEIFPTMPLVNPDAEDNKPEHVINWYAQQNIKPPVHFIICAGLSEKDKKEKQSFYKNQPHVWRTPIFISVPDGYMLFDKYLLYRNINNLEGQYYLYKVTTNWKSKEQKWRLSSQQK